MILHLWLYSLNAVAISACPERRVMGHTVQGVDCFDQMILRLWLYSLNAVAVSFCPEGE